MISIDPQASLKYFRSIASHTDRDVQRRLDRFQSSLETWLHSALNWPQDDWEADLRLFVEHTRYAGWEISPHSLAQIRELLEARARRTGPFAVALPPGRRASPAIQLAAVRSAPGDDTDATLDLTSEDEEELEGRSIWRWQGRGRRFRSRSRRRCRPSSIFSMPWLLKSGRQRAG